VVRGELTRPLDARWRGRATGEGLAHQAALRAHPHARDPLREVHGVRGDGHHVAGDLGGRELARGEMQHGGRPARVHRRPVEHGVLGVAAREPCEPRSQQPERKLAAHARGAVVHLQRGVHTFRRARHHPQQARPATTDREAMPAGVRLDDLGAAMVELAARQEGHELRADGGGRCHQDGAVIERLVDAGSVRHRQRAQPAPLPHAHEAVVRLEQQLAAGGDLSEHHAGPEAILRALVDALRPRGTHALSVQTALDAWHVPLGIAAVRRSPLPQPEAPRRAHEAGAVLRCAPNADGSRAARVRQLGPAQAGE
jgi:hypothetical protein